MWRDRRTGAHASTRTGTHTQTVPVSLFPAQYTQTHRHTHTHTHTERERERPKHTSHDKAKVKTPPRGNCPAPLCRLRTSAAHHSAVRLCGASGSPPASNPYCPSRQSSSSPLLFLNQSRRAPLRPPLCFLLPRPIAHGPCLPASPASSGSAPARLATDRSNLFVCMRAWAGAWVFLLPPRYYCTCRLLWAVDT